MHFSSYGNLKVIFETTFLRLSFSSFILTSHNIYIQILYIYIYIYMYVCRIVNMYIYMYVCIIEHNNSAKFERSFVFFINNKGVFPIFNYIHALPRK